MNKYIKLQTKEYYKDFHPIQFLDSLQEIRKILKRNTIEWRIQLKQNEISLFKWHLKLKEIEIEFGKWSHTFNQVLRKQIELMLSDNPDPEIIKIGERYKYVYAYWWNTFHYFYEVLSKRSIILHGKKRKNIEQGANTLEKLILGEIEAKHIHPKFMAIIDRLNKTNFEGALNEKKTIQ
jgi:hypothetical protein